MQEKVEAVRVALRQPEVPVAQLMAEAEAEFKGNQAFYNSGHCYISLYFYRHH